MPILCPHAARSCVQEPKGNRCERRGGSGAIADSSDFGLFGEQSSPKWEIPGLAWTPMNRRAINLTPLALSSAEISVTVQTNKKHTK